MVSSIKLKLLWAGVLGGIQEQLGQRSVVTGLRMSRSSSTGDLVPKDITEILALQASKKKRGSSLGRAFSWFKSSKRKRSVSNGQSRSGGQCGRSGESATAKQMHASSEASKAGQKQDEQRKLTVHYTASQHYQENVFIEGSRPQYLEDLHTEAQEGLKILQQEVFLPCRAQKWGGLSG
ncbi:uncharacterized protein KIAA1522 homolog isoform X8 [Ctenopharyngodon idella]|uniref:uncharacterized protein KIAA1522 homolog isoform X8 n=1 Tax=Ctenopharyngodon idella TaxID=7959 RepID=UPI00223043DE|nr:uncharacterized protein KIAA1522 homolog isoform X8 [Ctenopharyngodon idella]